MLSTDTEEASRDLDRKIKALNQFVWKNKVNPHEHLEWVGKFGTNAHDDDRAEQIRRGVKYLLTRFTFVDSSQRDVLLRYLFRHFIRYPIIREALIAGVPLSDHEGLERSFRSSLARTAVIPLGGPSKSGAHLIYPLRQVSGIPKPCFLDEGWPEPPDDHSRLRLIVIDDFAGTADQAIEYLQPIEARVEEALDVGWAYVDPELLFLSATTTALEKLRAVDLYLDVNTAYELDETHRVFGATSRYRTSAYDLDWSDLHVEVERVGTGLQPSGPLGYGDCQLLLGFDHNTPDNTLPVFWHGEDGFPAPFPRRW